MNTDTLNPTRMCAAGPAAPVAPPVPVAPAAPADCGRPTAPGAFARLLHQHCAPGGHTGDAKPVQTGADARPAAARDAAHPGDGSRAQGTGSAAAPEGEGPAADAPGSDDHGPDAGADALMESHGCESGDGTGRAGRGRGPAAAAGNDAPATPVAPVAAALAGVPSGTPDLPPGDGVGSGADAPVAGALRARRGPDAMRPGTGRTPAAAHGDDVRGRDPTAVDARGSEPAVASEALTGPRSNPTPVATDLAPAVQDAGGAVATPLHALAAPAAGAAREIAASAAPSAALPVPIATALDAPEFAHHLGAQISVLARTGVQRAELRLNPAEMGPVAVQIALDGERAHVDFGADRAATRDVLQASLPALATALREAGFTLAGGGVSARGGGDAAPGQGGPHGGGADGSDRASRRGATMAHGSAAAEAPLHRAVHAGAIDLYA